MHIIKAYDLSSLPTVFLSPFHRERLVSPESVSHVSSNESPLVVNNFKGKIITGKPSVWLSPWLFFFISLHCMLKEVNRKKILIILLFTDDRIRFYCFYFKYSSNLHPKLLLSLCFFPTPASFSFFLVANSQLILAYSKDCFILYMPGTLWSISFHGANGKSIEYNRCSVIWVLSISSVMAEFGQLIEQTFLIEKKWIQQFLVY